MKKILAIAGFLVGWGMLALSQVQFTEVTSMEEMQDARQRASDQQLMMFVDVYATWCGPCKLMDQQVYTDPLVAEYMNAHFVNVRLDGESEYGRIYAAEQQLQGYPSMFIFSREGEPVSKVIGFTPAEELVTTLSATVENYKLVRKYRTEFERGTIGDEELASYIEAVREMGNQDEAERLAARYMERVMDDKLSDRDIRVVAFYTDLQDSWWPAFAADQDRLKRVLGEDYLLAMEKIYNNSLVLAVDQENIETISKMANELAPLVDESETTSWDLRSQPFLQYYYYTDQVEALIQYVDERFHTDRKDDHAWLYGAASQITDMDQQYRTQRLLEKEVEWFQTCIDLDPQFDYFFYHGMVLYLLKNQEEAKASFIEAEKLASTDEQQEMIAQVLSFINNSR